MLVDPFTAPIRRELRLFEERLDAALRADVRLAHEIARYMATLRGKRLRPALALLGAQAVGLDDGRIIDAAVAVEMIHAATMVHDDVVDSATMRRGKASVSSAWSGQLAVLMGDFLLSRALGILVGLGDLEALAVVAEATQRLSMGEIFEIQIGAECDTTEESYIRMVGDKTASLISAAARLGPILARADGAIVEAMGLYGESLGRAFQIADDVLDYTGDARALGKPVGIDLREGRITLPLIRALEGAPPAVRADIHQLLRRADKAELEWARIVAFVEDYRGVPAARRTALMHADRARQCLRALSDSPARAALEMAVHLVVDRDN